MKDFYGILGIPRTATSKEIKDAYKTLVKLCHPDKGGNPIQFKEVTEAYEVLSDPKLRAMYDKGEYTKKSRSTEDLARAKLAELFSQAIDSVTERSAVTKNVVEDMKKAVSVTITQVQYEIGKLEQRLVTLAEVNKRTSGKDSMLNDVVENKINETKKVISEGKESIETLKKLMANCEDYSYKTDADNNPVYSCNNLLEMLYKGELPS